MLSYSPVMPMAKTHLAPCNSPMSTFDLDLTVLSAVDNVVLLEK